MNIQALINSQYNAIQTLFDAYGINKPVNVDNVSAAIVLFKTDDGNLFLDDLMLLAQSENNYEDFLKRNPEKKAAAKARRAEKRGGLKNTTVGKLFSPKNPSVSATNAQQVLKATNTVSDLAVAASKAPLEETNPGGLIADKAPGLKIEDVFSAAGQAASGIADGISTIRNSGKEDEPEDNVTAPQTPLRKYLPWIIGGVVVIGGIVIYLVTRKK